MEFVRKCVIVTGSSSGIGRAAALEYARGGASVLIHGRDQQAVSDTVKQCTHVGHKDAKFPSVLGDVNDLDTLHAIHKHAIAEFQQLDILVNNAGTAIEHDISTPHVQLFDKHLNMMLRAPVYLSQLCLPQLKQSGGNIVNVSSMKGCRPSTPASYYNMAKAGLNMFTQCAALEYGAQGVRVNAVCPGNIPTPLMSKVINDQIKTQRFFDRMKKISPLNRLGSAEECAKLIVFISSDNASIINGACIVNDGGESLRGLDLQSMRAASKL